MFRVGAQKAARCQFNWKKAQVCRVGESVENKNCSGAAGANIHYSV